MALPTVLTTQLAHLSCSVGVDDDTTAAMLAELVVDLQRTVVSYLGLRLVLLDHDHAVTLTVVEPAVQAVDVVTSMCLPLSLLRLDGVDPGSVITFYAGTAGAFTDLAADLSYALQLPHHGSRQGLSAPEENQDRISLDDAVSPSTLLSGLTGSAELCTINRAIGMLIGNGHHPDDAYAELGRQAASGHISILSCATRLVRPNLSGQAGKPTIGPAPNGS